MLIREAKETSIGIKKVNYICLREACFKMLKDEVSAYGDYFSVELREAPQDMGSV